MLKGRCEAWMAAPQAQTKRMAAPSFRETWIAFDCLLARSWGVVMTTACAMNCQAA